MSLSSSSNDQETVSKDATSVTDQQSAAYQANVHIKEYLKANVPTFLRLSKLREKGWANREGDIFFQSQRNQADKSNEKGRQFFYGLMKRIGQELQDNLKAFKVNNINTSPLRILDMCMAPGAFLETALRLNPGAQAVAFTLPEEAGGHKVLLPRNKNVKINFLDITMLAEDMGTARADIATEHPDATKFLSQHLSSDMRFNLVLCDGQVLRTHEPHRASYREPREARRLRLTQLALGLEHLQPGGTMMVLLHKVESWDTVCLLHSFSKFSDVRVFKPKLGHQKRSSFYMIAQKVQTGSQEATAAVQEWKRQWKIATFSGDEEYRKFAHDSASVGSLGVHELLEEFGATLVKLGEDVWRIQADALAKASFMRK